jgi:hypothetical protein
MFFQSRRNATRQDIDELAGLLANVERDGRAELLAACEAAMVWVVMMCAGGDEFRHPQSLKNAREDLERLRRAAALAKGEPYAPVDWRDS